MLSVRFKYVIGIGVGAGAYVLPSVGTSVLRFALVVFAPSVLQGLCALAGFVCYTTLGSPERAHLFGVTVHGLLMD